MSDQFKQGDWSELKQKAQAAGGKSWSWWTSCSFNRLTIDGERDGGALSASVCVDGVATIDGPEAVRDFIAAANPSAILALIAENERLQADAGSGRDHGSALQQVGSALGLPAGSDLHADCVPKIYSLFTSIGRTIAEDAQAHVRFSAERDQLRAEVEALQDAIKDMLFAMQADPSCQMGVVERCRCWFCAIGRAKAAMPNEAGGSSAENTAETRENTGREAGGQGEVR